MRIKLWSLLSQLNCSGCLPFEDNSSDVSLFVSSKAMLLIESFGGCVANVGSDKLQLHQNLFLIYFSFLIFFVSVWALSFSCGQRKSNGFSFHHWNVYFIVPTPLVGGGEELYTQMGFFCSVNFGRSIYSSQRNVSGIIKKLVQRRIQN